MAIKRICGACSNNLGTNDYCNTCNKFPDVVHTEITLDESNMVHFSGLRFHFVEDMERILFGIDPGKPQEKSSASWVSDKVSLKAMLKALKQRPHSRFPEVEEFHNSNNKYCMCDTCYSLRRQMIKQIQDDLCENR